MAIFKLYDCDVIITLKGVNYFHDHVDSVAIEDPEMRQITKGVNAQNKMGIVYMTGTKEPKNVSFVAMDLPSELVTAYTKACEDEERMDFSVVSRRDGSSFTAKNSILTQKPQQLTLDESPESMNVTLALQSFDTKWEHKS